MNNKLSSNNLKKQKVFRKRKLPEHVTPSPENTLLQAHVKEPTVLVQSAFASQLSVLAVHSSTSRIQRRVIHTAEFMKVNINDHALCT